ncbi:RNA polymerase sigma factor [Rhizocola hellebori]|uniref:RNA polymerase sigma factor n=1 Tax=Rhizocola hellebori TaxID=1392758 RepID=A0A8J3Q274_9ACTN|nr:sigma-70 family RNA polymerase sigma factor [Rhizocola hellebori]GIH02119.1 RNA polymerase sigma factor [Rhizocola hellebori]
MNLPEADIKSLLDAAATGDQRAWSSIVDKYSGLVWTVARSFRLGSADAADIHQATWLRLVEQLGRIRDPERLGAWLATTARREALALLRRAGHDLPASDLLSLDRHDASQPELDDDMLQRERDKFLWAAVGQLPMNCQRLLRLMVLDPPPSYHEISAALEIPIGSIGPTRSRCLDQLRQKVTV